MTNFCFEIRASSDLDEVNENFTKIQQIHDHNTKRSKEIVNFVPRFSKSLGQNHILHRGTELWNELEKI